MSTGPSTADAASAAPTASLSATPSAPVTTEPLPQASTSYIDTAPTEEQAASSQPLPTASSSSSSSLGASSSNSNSNGSGAYTVRKAPTIRSSMTPAPFPGDKAPATSATTPAAPASTPAFPALHLIPLNETFVPKQISLHPAGQRIKIGRQTNAKTIPNGTNGYFDSKVLSRMHAEVWSEDNKVLIKDVKSSNGTFIDGQRLSAEAAESDVFELRTGSTVEFGIDIVSDDSKTIVHHKVAAKVHCVMNTEDAIASAREFSAWYRNAGDQPSQRRGIRPVAAGGPQANGLSFEHVLNRLQGELQKSRDTGTHLGDLSSSLNEVQDTLGGAPPPSNFHARNGNPFIPNGHSSHESEIHAQSIAALQTQLNETQSSLAGHVGKIRDLEGLLAEHDVIKREVGSLRKQMEEAKRDMEMMMRGRSGESESTASADGRESPVAKLLEAQEEDEDDDDDARSVSSVDTVTDTGSKLVNGVLSASGLSNGSDSKDGTARSLQLQEQNAQLSARLETLSAELEEATRLGQSLRSQHAEASSTIRALEERVQGLEKAVDRRVAEAEGKVLREVEGRWDGWRAKFEASWQQERQGWHKEREALLQVVRDWREQRRDESASEDDEDDDSDEEATGTVGGDGTDVTSALASTAAGTRRKRSRSRRRRRSAASRAAKLDAAIGEGSAGRDRLKSGSGSSESTLTRDPSAWSSTGSAGWSDRGKSSTPGGAGESKAGAPNSNLPYASAGAVVIIGVAAAWALSMKLKE